MKLDFSRQIFGKYSDIRYENGAELFHAGGRTDRYDEANSRFSRFVFISCLNARPCLYLLSG